MYQTPRIRLNNFLGKIICWIRRNADDENHMERFFVYKQSDNLFSGFINTFLSWKGFIPLSRLTYCAYLVHPVVIYHFQYTRQRLIHFSDTEMVSVLICQNFFLEKAEMFMSSEKIFQERNNFHTKY